MKQLEEDYQHGLKANWQQQIGAFIKWKQPHLPGFEFHNECDFKGSKDEFEDLESNPIFVSVALMKPGKNYYCIQYQNRTEEDSKSQCFSEAIECKEDYPIYLHKTIVPCRTAPIPLFLKNMQAQVVEREFVHKTSVFARWKPDTKKAQRLAVEKDMVAMNLSKLCRNESDLASL